METPRSNGVGSVESTFGIIVAFLDGNRGFAFEGHLPWPYIKVDHDFYVNICRETKDPAKKNGILKGRNCWESMPNGDRDHPKTSIAVVSTTMDKVPPHCRTVVSNYQDGMDDLIKGVNSGELENIWVLGGLKNYELAIEDPRVTRLYISRIFKDFPVDLQFPEFEHRFHRIGEPEIHKDGETLLQFETWERTV